MVVEEAPNPRRRPCESPVQPLVTGLGDSPLPFPDQFLSASFDAFTQEQRLTNAILREVAVALGAKKSAAVPSAKFATTMQTMLASVNVGEARPFASVVPAALKSAVKAAEPQYGAESALEVAVKPDETAHESSSIGASTPKSAKKSPSASPESKSKTQSLEERMRLASTDTMPNDTIALQPLKSWGNKMFRWTESNGGKGKQLTRYDFDSIAAWAAIPFILCSCSIFRLRRSLSFQMLGQVVVIAAVCFSIRVQDLDASNFEQIREDSDAVIQMTVALKTFVPFFLGLFISLCLSRWWSLRAGHLQGLLSAVGKLSFWLRATLPEHASWIRHRVERECMLGHKLVYLCARGKQDSEHLDKLEQQGFLTKAERHTLTQQIKELPQGAEPLTGLFDFDLAAMPFTRAAHLIYRVFLYGNRTKGEYGITIPPPVCVRMLSYCMDAWKCIEGIEMTLSSPLPFPYFHLVCLLVHFTTLCECVRAGIILGTAGTFSTQHVVCEVFTTLAGNALYLGMLCLAAVLTDPFGNDIVDFPGEMFQHRLLKAQYFASMLTDDGEMDHELEMRLGGAHHAQLRASTLKGSTEDEHDEHDEHDEFEEAGEDGGGADAGADCD